MKQITIRTSLYLYWFSSVSPYDIYLDDLFFFGILEHNSNFLMQQK